MTSCPGNHTGRVSTRTVRIHPSTQAGFSLLELLAVVAIVGIIAAIAVPNLTQSTKAANEASAIGYMRTWSTAQEMYHRKHGTYASDTQLLVDEGYLPHSGEQNGYTFETSSSSQYFWAGNARPVSPGATGERYFYSDVTGVIRYALDGDAGPSSPPITGSDGDLGIIGEDPPTGQ